MNPMRLVKILKVFGSSTAKNLHYPHQVCPADMFTSAWPLTGRDWRRPGERRRRIGEPLGRALRFRESSPEKRLAVLQLFFLVTSPTHYGVRAAKRRRGQARCDRRGISRRPESRPERAPRVRRRPVALRLPTHRARGYHTELIVLAVCHEAARSTGALLVLRCCRRVLHLRDRAQLTARSVPTSRLSSVPESVRERLTRLDEARLYPQSLLKLLAAFLPSAKPNEEPSKVVVGQWKIGLRTYRGAIVLGRGLGVADLLVKPA